MSDYQLRVVDYDGGKPYRIRVTREQFTAAVLCSMERKLWRTHERCTASTHWRCSRTLNHEGPHVAAFGPETFCATNGSLALWNE